MTNNKARIDQISGMLDDDDDLSIVIVNKQRFAMIVNALKRYAICPAGEHVEPLYQAARETYIVKYGRAPNYGDEIDQPAN